MFLSVEISSTLNSIKPQRNINFIFSPDSLFLPNNSYFSSLFTETLIFPNLENFTFLDSCLVKKTSYSVSNNTSGQSNSVNYKLGPNEFTNLRM